MYEFRAGTGRLLDELDRAKADRERLQALADILYYYPDQLEQDITAAVDFYDVFRDVERPEET